LIINNGGIVKTKMITIVIVLTLFSGLIFGQSIENDPLLDKEIAEKYGLEVPSPINEMDSAPNWVLKADMTTYGGWKGYKNDWKPVMVTRKSTNRTGGKYERKYPSAKHTLIEGVFDASSFKGVPYISTVFYSKTAFEQVHKEGIRVIGYVHFTDIAVGAVGRSDQEYTAFEHPEIIVKDNEGRWLHTPMDGTYQFSRFLTCANSPSFWKLSLASVKKIMDMGADGIFVDNVHDRRDPCMAPTFNEENDEYPGFRPWQHPSLEPYRLLYNGEFGKYQHDHLFPNATHDYAFDRLLQAVRALVKSYGEDKIVVLNSGLNTPFQKNGDMCMWESFIYSWAWEGRGHTWEDVKKFAEINKEYIKAGRRIVGLSSWLKHRNGLKEDAFWAFTSARLVDMILRAYLDDTGAEILYSTHLGEPLQSFQESDGIVTRIFENGILVLNNTEKDKEIEITLPGDFKQDKLLDIFDGKRIILVKDGEFRINVPGDKARIYYNNHKE